MGGMEGFGPVEPEPNEPPFHTKWEGRALAMNRASATRKIWNIDKSRAKIEEMPPHDYLTKTYYQKWAHAAGAAADRVRLSSARTRSKAGHSLRPGKPLPRFLPAADVNKALSRGSYSREPTGAGALQGRRSRAHQEHPSADPHAAAALRARQGRRRSNACAASTCSRTRSRSARARTRNGSTRWCSTASELWGEAADPTLKVSIEAWEPYLEPA